MLIKDTEAFKRAIAQIASNIDEANVHIKRDSLELCALDKTNVLCLKAFFPSSLFENLQEVDVFGINFTELNKLISKISTNEKIELSFKENELSLSISGVYQRKYYLPVLDLNDPEVFFKTGNYPAYLETNAEVLKDIFRSISEISSSVSFNIRKNLKISAKGINGRFEAELPIKSSDCFESCFATAPLYSAIRYANENIVLKLKANAPLYIKYNIGSITLEYLIAHMLI